MTSPLLCVRGVHTYYGSVAALKQPEARKTPAREDNDQAASHRGAA